MKTIKFPPDNSEQFKDYLRAGLSQNDDRGYSIDEVRVLIRVLDTIDAAGTSIELEDAHYAAVKQRVDNIRWRVATADIVTFVDCIADAK